MKANIWHWEWETEQTKEKKINFDKHLGRKFRLSSCFTFQPPLYHDDSEKSEIISNITWKWEIRNLAFEEKKVYTKDYQIGEVEGKGVKKVNDAENVEINSFSVFSDQLSLCSIFSIILFVVSHFQASECYELFSHSRLAFLCLNREGNEELLNCGSCKE